MSKKGKQGKIVLTKSEYRQTIKKLAQAINQHYRFLNAKKIVVIGLLRGCFMVLSDLVKLLEPICTIEFMKITRYGTDKMRKQPVIDFDIDTDIKEKYVLVVDDCSDERITLAFVHDTLSPRGPKQIDFCVLLDKPDNVAPGIKLKIKFVGKAVGSEFVAGCGLDETDAAGDSINRNLEEVYICE